MRVVVLAHEQFPDRAKTAVGILRYSEHEVVAVLDRDRAGTRVNEYVPDVQDAPIVSNVEAVEKPVDALIIGIAPIGGDFDPSWRPDVRAAITAGADVFSGLHYFLTEDDEFASLAASTGSELHDLRKPPTDLDVAAGTARELDVPIITTVGTDCSVGKMTTTMELANALTAAGYDAGVVPTGQTGLLIEGWGIAVDRVPGDFINGAVERMIKQAATEHELLIVEGQGSIVHPAYSAVTMGILHGSMPDGMVLCHTAGRDRLHGYESVSMPPIETYVRRYEELLTPIAPSQVIAGGINTSNIEQQTDARAAVQRFSEAAGVPATDPVRFGTDRLVQAVESTIL